MHTINWENVRSLDRLATETGRRLDHTNVRDMASYVARQLFAWPGGYDLFVITNDGGCLCSACVRSNFELVYTAAKDDRDHSGWRPEAVACSANFDGPVDCDHCGRVIVEGEDE